MFVRRQYAENDESLRSAAYIYRDWFAFDLPNFGAPITAATVSIWNASTNFTNNPAAVYNLFGASAITFASLALGPPIGSDPLATADNGISHYESIDLNASGLARLNAHEGSTVLFGGDVAGAAPFTDVTIFGCTDGNTSSAAVDGDNGEHS